MVSAEMETLDLLKKIVEIQSRQSELIEKSFET